MLLIAYEYSLVGGALKITKYTFFNRKLSELRSGIMRIFNFESNSIQDFAPESEGED